MRERSLKRFYAAFPAGLPGAALLLQRTVIAIAMLVQGGLYLREPLPTAGSWFVGLAALCVATLLLAGLLTPITGTVAALGGIAVGLSLLPASTSTLFDSRTPIAFAATMLVTSIVLGPGAFSVDARLFGRREIIIPTPGSKAKH